MIFEQPSVSELPKDLEFDIKKELATRGNRPAAPQFVGPAKINAWFDAILAVVREKQASEARQ